MGDCTTLESSRLISNRYLLVVCLREVMKPLCAQFFFHPYKWQWCTYLINKKNYMDWFVVNIVIQLRNKSTMSVAHCFHQIMY